MAGGAAVDTAAEGGFDADDGLTETPSVRADMPVPEPIVAALRYIHRVRGLIDPNRAAHALGVPREVYDNLAGPGSRVDRRIVSMAAEKLELADASLPLGRFRLPIPRSQEHVLDAARTIGITASLALRGNVMTRLEYDALVEAFDEPTVKRALKLRRLAAAIGADLGWPLTAEAAITYGSDVLVAWARLATPALARLILTALPLGIGEGKVHIGYDTIALDELLVTVIEHHWRETEPQE